MWLRRKGGLIPASLTHKCFWVRNSTPSGHQAVDVACAVKHFELSDRLKHHINVANLQHTFPSNSFPTVKAIFNICMYF